MGFGSAAFHCTQTWTGELLDELGMYVASLLTCFTLRDVHPLTTGRKGALLYSLVSIFGLTIWWIYMEIMHHPFFSVCFIISVFLTVYLLATLPVKHSRSTSSLVCGVALSLMGYGIWVFDQVCVQGMWEHESEYPYELVWYYWSHPAWHVLTALGVHFLLESIIFGLIASYSVSCTNYASKGAKKKLVAKAADILSRKTSL